MKPPTRYLVLPLIMMLLLSTMGCATTDLPHAKKMQKGDVAQEDGVFLNAEGAKKQAQVTKERDALREEYRDYPGKTDRLLRTLGAFGAGVGLGILFPLLVP